MVATGKRDCQNRLIRRPKQLRGVINPAALDIFAHRDTGDHHEKPLEITSAHPRNLAELRNCDLTEKVLVDVVERERDAVHRTELPLRLSENIAASQDQNERAEQIVLRDKLISFALFIISSAQFSSDVHIAG